MNGQQVLILLIDKEHTRASLLSAKLIPLGYQVHHCISVQEALNFLSHTSANLIIIEQTLMDSYAKNLKKELKQMGLLKATLFLLETQNKSSLKSYFAKGVEGVLEKSISSRAILDGIRKSLLPQNMQWQVTLNRLPVESLSFIGESLDELHGYKNLSFGNGGFSTKFDKELQLGDRVGYSIYFKEHGQAYVIQGVAVVRWVEKSSFWAGIEFESMYGQGVEPFLNWLANMNLDEFIPEAA
ncbi:MAG: hypothetical protein KDD58_13025 [Bdellovibrionales bacterium]|nr:hypothetical protein [Bdellovibrionales bacterium]